jgi:hypothetical protein
MASKWNHPKNDGWTDVDYDFGLPLSERAALSKILNEACHVFHYHADGNWKTAYKDNFASLVATYIEAHPGLPHRLLRSEDRVVKILTYRALEILEHPKNSRFPVKPYEMAE